MSIVIVEGNIGAGKSTLCEHLARALGYQLVPEPVAANPYLADFYRDPRRWALEMQMWFLEQRFRAFVDALRAVAQTGGGLVFDRSVFGDCVFADKNRRDGNIDADGFAAYTRLRRRMLALLPRPTVVVYLDVDVAECFRRVHHVRRRECELGITLEYLAGIDKCYAAFLLDLQRVTYAPPVPVLIVPWTTFGSSEAVAALVRKAVARSGACWPPNVLENEWTQEWADAVLAPDTDAKE